MSGWHDITKLSDNELLGEKDRIVDPFTPSWYSISQVEKEIKRRKLHGNLKSGILLYGTLALIGVFVFSKIKNR
jgi:hypothetical protein